MKHADVSVARFAALLLPIIVSACASSGDTGASAPAGGTLEPFPPGAEMADNSSPSTGTSGNASDLAASPQGSEQRSGSSESVEPVGLVGAAGAAAGASTGGGGAGGATSMSPEPPPLGGKFVGNISTRGQIRPDFPMYWNQFSPENEGKWGSVQPNQGIFNWGALDKEYAFAEQNHIIFKEHNFIWGKQQPNWVNDGNAQTAVQAWMNAFCQRYPDVKVIDVVNEPPPHTTPAYINGLGGAGTSGYDWIASAFKLARQACPNAILLLNDYSNIENDGDNNHTIDIVTRIKAMGAPIDGVGAQSHGLANAKSADVKRRIDNIMGKAGLPVYITEFDLDIADDQKQMAVMQDLFTMFWNDANVRGVTIWGYIVGSTWETNTGLMQANGQMRPAMSWLMNFLAQQR
jgi:endo-1,4-beta-xylanase